MGPLRPTFEALRSKINEERIVKSLLDLLERPSENALGGKAEPGYNEVEVSQYIRAKLKSYGLSVSVIEVHPGRPNVVAYLNGSREGPTLMLEGHMDTARTDSCPQLRQPQFLGDRVVGRGACDMKGALAVFIEVARILAQPAVQFSGRLLVCCVCDEEYAMEGAKYVGQYGPEADFVIVGEPTGLEVCSAAKGRVSLEIAFSGRAAHSSMPEFGVNAVYKSAKAVAVLEQHAERLMNSGSHPLCGSPRLTVGVIKGGIQVNMVPDLCVIEIDRRTLPGESISTVYDEIESLLGPISDVDSGFAYRLSSPTWYVPSYELSSGHRLLDVMLQARRVVLGDDNPEPTGFPAGSDIGWLEIPGVICGPGSLEAAHTSYEFVTVEQLVKAAEVYLYAATELLEVSCDVV